MKNIEYNIPVYEDEDMADLKEYSERMAAAIKGQVDKFGNPLIFKGRVENLEELKAFADVQNGYIYMVKSENKNYIYNGIEWIEYSENKSLEAGDGLPVGTIVEYEGTTVPDGYEEVEEKVEVYSTEETKIGTWIDGKPLYRKVIVRTNNFSTNTMIPHNILNLQEIVNIQGTILIGENDYRPIQTIYQPDATNNLGIYSIYNGSISFFMGSYFVTRISKISVILEYTKTTD